MSDRHSCQPLWKPLFISQYINEDRCHLNGLAMVCGEAKYVTAMSQSDVVDGWRDRRQNGGILELDELLAAKDAELRCGMMIIDMNTGAIVHWLRFEGIATELYDVQIIPEAQKPMALGFPTDEIAQ